MTMQAGGKESAGRHRRMRGTFTLEVEWQGGRVYLHLGSGAMTHAPSDQQR